MSSLLFRKSAKLSSCASSQTISICAQNFCRKINSFQASRKCPIHSCSRIQRNDSLQRCTPLILSRSTHKNHTRHFSASKQHSLRRSEYFQSSKTSRKSASIIVSNNVEAKEVPEAQNSLLQQRYVYVQTSVNRWEDVPAGLLFDTAYLDSAPGDDINPSVPLVVSLHNTPGSFYDMQPVLEAFVKNGCRVLAPAFPGLGTEGVVQADHDVFAHSTNEKAEFVRDFLATLQVKKVDLLIGHGAGCYPAMRLTAGNDTSSMFKSTAFVSPWPHRDFKGTSQRNLLPLLHDMWERPYYRTMVRGLSRFFINTANTTAIERVSMIYTLYHLDFSEVGGFGVALDVQNFPRVMMFAEDDPFVDAELSYELADMFGIGPESTHHFSGQLEKGKMDQFPSCLVFDKGGQNIHTQHPGVITAVLFNLLKSVRPGFRTF